MLIRIGFPILLSLLVVFVGPLNSYGQVQTVPFKVGVVLPLTGPLAEFGEAVQNGIELATEENRNWSASCRFVFEDCEYKGAKAIAAMDKLIGSDRVSLVYNWGTVTSMPLAPVAESRHIPLIVWAADPRIGNGRRYIVRFSNAAQDYGRSLADYLNSNKRNRLTLVLAETQYLLAMSEGLKQELKPGQQLSIFANVQPTEHDFRSIVSKLRGQPIDALGVYLISGQVSEFYREMAKQRLSIPTFGTDFLESEVEIKAAGPAIESAVYANNSVNDNFRQKYLRRFGNDTQITHAGNGYDFAHLACEILSSSTDSDSIIENLIQIQNRTGVQGNFAYKKSASGDQSFSFPVVVKEVKGGNIVELKSQ